MNTCRDDVNEDNECVESTLHFDTERSAAKTFNSQ